MDPVPRDSTAATSAEPAGGALQDVRRRRRRKGRERVRVTRACDQCKRQKIRCTGALPCEVCTRKGNQCSYNAVYSRGRAPAIALDVEGIGSSSAARQSLVEEHPIVSPRRDPRSEPVSSRAPSPDSLQTDRQGHYVGPASGVSFLLRVQWRVHQAFQHPQKSSIFTFGDAPLPEFDGSFFVLPQKEDTRRLLERYFDFAVPTHRFLHRPTVEAWFEELYATSGSMGQREESPARIAVLFMVFAQASVYTPAAAAGDGAPAQADASAQFFLAAEHQLQKERGQVRLASVQARLAQCFYLLSQSRINHAWSLFGTTAHLALAIGLNRRRRRRPPAGRVEAAAAAADRVEAECRRRVFWCAYTLDKYLAAALGRPRAIREEDVDQELPSCVDDADLLAAVVDDDDDDDDDDGPSARPGRGQPLMRAAIAHVRLARIVDQILRDLYPIWPLSTPVRLSMADRCSRALKDWHREQQDFLDPGRISAALFLPIYQRQRSALNLAYWHATILTHRSFLLGKFGTGDDSPTSTSRKVASQDQRVETHIRECLEAAVKICELLDELIKTKTMFKGFWFTIYYAFCAVAVLYVHAIQHDAADDCAKHLASATRCHAQLSTMAEEHSLTSRYCTVLEELKKEALQASQETSDARRAVGGHISNEAGVSTRQPRAGANTTTEPQMYLLEEQAPLLPENYVTTSQASALDVRPESFHDISGWGVFDSMASSPATS